MMPSEQAIAVVVFLVLLAISVLGYFIASREGDRLDRLNRSQRMPDEPMGLGNRPLV